MTDSPDRSSDPRGLAAARAAALAALPVADLPSPCYAVDLALLEANARVLDGVRGRTGCKVLLALKAFSMFSTFPTLRPCFDGTAASSIDEARLGAESFGGEVHIYSPAYREHDFPLVLKYASHISFNSFSQWRRFRQACKDAGPRLQCSLRINPRHSEVRTTLYDPCQPFSRLGVGAAQFEGEDIEGLAGLHFHTLCELGADALERTLEVVARDFGPYLRRVKWVNFGGGHHITKDGYDVDRLCRLIDSFRSRFGCGVYLEPGEAVALDAGVFVATVEDIVRNEMSIAVLDASAAAHLPDVLEMPYRPAILGAEPAGRLPYTYRLGGSSCLAGDTIGDYSFSRPLAIGDRLVFLDMAHYTMVKNTTFNGIRLPSIVLLDSRTGRTEVVRTFGFEDFRSRLS